MKKPPCFGCTDRTSECSKQNVNCKKYAEWKKEHEAKREAIRTQNVAEYRFSSYKRLIHEKNEKKRRHACGEE